MSNTQTYIVRTPLKRDGAPIKPGEPVELSGDEAGPLLAVGAIAASTREEGSADDPATGSEPPTGEAKQGAASDGDDPAAGSAAAGESSGEPNDSEADDPSGAAQRGDESTPDGQVNVNTASAAAIALAAKGIGKKTAADIVAHRDEKGSFASLDDLTAVGGISQAIVDDNRDVLTV